MYKIHRKVKLPISIDQAWKFFSSPLNLNQITPPSLNLQITSKREEKIYPGMIITYKVAPILSIPINWLTEITDVKEPSYFVDQQLHGPYKVWHHQHFFHEIEGGVEIEDIVDYVLPFGFFGQFCHHLFVKKQVNNIFDFRERTILCKLQTGSN